MIYILSNSLILARAGRFSISNNKSGQQHQIRSNSEILLAQISVRLRFVAGAHVFEAAEIQIREQIRNPCLLLASGLRDYEIKLDRRISAARKSLKFFLSAKQEHSS
jgi:hypothetical protein|eukprot:SAG25_NODE_1265_length_3457_cov_7.332638_2_plen_107_part_00